MESDRQLFNQLLEEYVLKVVEIHFTDLDKEMKARLFKLIISLIDESPENSDKI